MDIQKPKMNINLDIDLETIGKKFKKAPLFLDKKRRLVLIFIALMFSGHAFYEYYNYVYRPVWSAKKRADYVATKEKDAVFDENNFNTVISEIEKRKVEFIDNPRKDTKDIFKVTR